MSTVALILAAGLGKRMQSTLPKVLHPILGDPALLEVGLTAVLEAADGQLAYHALHHPLERPDFHDARGFMLRLDRRTPP